MIKTGEVQGERKNILIRRGEESLGRVAERAYLGEEKNTQISEVIFREEKKKGNQSSNKEGVEREERIKTLTGHSYYVFSVVFSPNGEYLASGSGDKTIIIWRVSSGKRIRTLIGHSDSVNSVVFSPNG